MSPKLRLSIALIAVALIAFPLLSAGAETHPSYKIGIVTGTVSQGEDEFRGAQMVAKEHPDLIKHVTYPDNFMQEQETTISQIAGLASDPAVKAIVIAQAIPGSVAAIKKVKATRPDLLFFLIEPHEDPGVINSIADFAVQPDPLERGRTIVEVAKKMGAKKFIHYSFPRHMSQEPLAKRRDRMAEVCKNLGMEFISQNAPDPMGENGLPGAQQFIKEDVPRQVAKYGKSVAFFSTNCGMQEPLIKATLETGAIFPEQCCPSPTHGYPGALGIEIPAEKAGDMNFIIQKIKDKITESGRGGRFATWKVAANILSIRACVDLASQVIEGKVKVTDEKAVQATYQRLAGEPKISLSKWDAKSGNYFLILAESVIF